MTHRVSTYYILAKSDNLGINYRGLTMFNIVVPVILTLIESEL